VREVWRLKRGAEVDRGGKGVRFSVWAPHAQQVQVRLLGGGAKGTHALRRGERGVFESVVKGAAAGDDYVYVLDGGAERPDPVSRHQPEGVHGPSRVVDPHAFRWSDHSWSGLEMPELVIYELHVGTFTEEGTFEGVIGELDRLKALGVTAIELMPVSQFPGERNWGYDGAHHYAPQHSYGGPDGLRRLIDAAHDRKIGVILDVVYNHLGPEGNYLGEFGPYFTDTYHTPWGSAINYDGSGSDEVRRWAIDNALYWTVEFHMDGLRLDAVHGIYDFSAKHLLREMADAVREEAALLGREVVVIAESDLNDPRLIEPVAAGGFALHGQWSDDFHHAVHAALTGERAGYYEGFGRIADIAKAIDRRFVYNGTYSPFRQRRHGAPAEHVPSDRFVISIQNHDQVGNRAHGERLSELLDFGALKIAASLMLMSPYVPLLFMGEEYGETNPFLYFVSHSDPELVNAVREGRRREFEAFAWEGDVPDPQAVETFSRSRPDRARRQSKPGQQLEALYTDLLHIRASEPALRAGNTTTRVASDEEDRCLVVELSSLEGKDLVALYNLSDEPRQLRIANAKPGSWALQFATSDQRYGGRGGAPRAMQSGAPGERRIDVGPLTAALYRLEND
jgi:maltooligosyltrehalose trehalohydrolase